MPSLSKTSKSTEKLLLNFRSQLKLRLVVGTEQINNARCFPRNLFFLKDAEPYLHRSNVGYKYARCCNSQETAHPKDYGTESTNM